MTSPTFNDLRDIGVQQALAEPSPRALRREALESRTTDAGIFVSVGAAQAEEVGLFAQRANNANRLATAASVSTDALEQWAASEYGVTRQGETSAIVDGSFVRDPAGAGITIPVGSLVGTDDGVIFRTTRDVVMPANVTLSETVEVVAVVAGRGGNVTAGTITRLLSVPQGPIPDSTLRFRHGEDAAGGDREQTVEEFEAQLQRFFVEAVRGTLSAIQFAAETTPGVVSARATEIEDEGRVVVHINGPNDQANSALARRVLERLQEYRPAGVGVSVLADQVRTIEIRIEGLEFDADVSANAVLDAAQTAIVEAVSALGPGEPLKISVLTATLVGVDGLQVPSTTTYIPAEDVVPSEQGETLRTRKDLVVLAPAVTTG
jgi:hypothetical protein